MALVFCFDNILHFVMAPLMMAIGGNSPSQSWQKMTWDVLKKIFTHPFIVATIFGVTAAVIEFKPPQSMDTLLGYLSNAAAPCALFAMGVTVALTPTGRIPRIMGALLPIKLVVHPVIVYFLVSWIGDFDPTWNYTAVLMASLPTATNVFVIAQQYDVWVARASSMVMVSTVLSVISVTGLLYLIASGILPPDFFPAQ